jgi:hypothetical protein
MNTMQVAFDRFIKNPTEFSRLTLDTMLDAYDCAANHQEPHLDCVFCQEASLNEVPELLQAQYEESVDIQPTTDK